VIDMKPTIMIDIDGVLNTLDTTEYDCCDECGDAIYNGEGYYDIDARKICETCMDGYHHIMDYDDRYTYQDYLTEKYERERHDDR